MKLEVYTLIVEEYLFGDRVRIASKHFKNRDIFELYYKAIEKDLLSKKYNQLTIWDCIGNYISEDGSVNIKYTLILEPFEIIEEIIVGEDGLIKTDL